MDKLIQKHIILALKEEAQTEAFICEKVASELDIWQIAVMPALYALLREKELQIIAGKYALAYRG